MYKVNRYKGRCIVCKQPVEAGGGILRKSKNNRFYIIGKECKPEKAGTKKAKAIATL